MAREYKQLFQKSGTRDTGFHKKLDLTHATLIQSLMITAINSQEIIDACVNAKNTAAAAAAAAGDLQ